MNARAGLLCLFGLTLLLGTPGCGHEVHVTLRRGECDDEALTDILSVQAELHRSDGVGVQRCISTKGVVTSLSGLEQLLADQVMFEDIPTGGNWTIWVQGFSADGCREITLLCGRVSGVSMPPSGDRVVIPIDCMSRLSTKKPEGLIACQAK